MNDVLPKPFTKEGMLKALEKHLPQFKKNAQQQFPAAAMSHPGGFVTPNTTHAPLGLNMGQLSSTQALKEEPSSGKSPATASSWHSPSQQIPNASPVGSAPPNFMQQTMGDSRQYSMTPTHPHPQVFPPSQIPATGAPRAAPHRRVMSDMTVGVPDDHPEKRQRMMYPPPPQGFPQ